MRQVSVETYVAREMSDRNAFIIPPGEDREFMGRSSYPFMVRGMVLVGPEQFRLWSLRRGTSEVRFDETLPRSQIKFDNPLALESEPLAAAEPVFAHIQNVGRAPAAVRPVFLGDIERSSKDDVSHLPARPILISDRKRRFVIPPASQLSTIEKQQAAGSVCGSIGEFSVSWVAPWVAQPKKMLIRTDSQFDVLMTDLRVGNRSQFLDATPWPVELFAEMRSFRCDTAACQQDVVFVFRNISEEPRWVEIDLEVAADGDRPASTTATN